MYKFKSFLNPCLHLGRVVVFPSRPKTHHLSGSGPRHTGVRLRSSGRDCEWRVIGSSFLMTSSVVVVVVYWPCCLSLPCHIRIRWQLSPVIDEKDVQYWLSFIILWFILIDFSLTFDFEMPENNKSCMIVACVSSNPLFWSYDFLNVAPTQNIVSGKHKHGQNSDL